jgi:hypothetical protein
MAARRAWRRGWAGRGRVLALAALLPTLAAADHGTPAARTAGGGWITWVLVAGALVAVVLAAWSVFAPERPAGPGEQAGDRPPDRAP